MVTQALVREVGPIDTIVCHLDVDGLYAAAKWLRGGSEPYAGADDDARAIDTRIGTPGPIADRIDRALRAHFRDEALKHRVVRYLVAGCKPGEHHDVIAQAAAEDKLPLPRFASLQSGEVNMRAGQLPPADESGKTFLKVPVNGL